MRKTVKQAGLVPLENIAAGCVVHHSRGICLLVEQWVQQEGATNPPT